MLQGQLIRTIIADETPEHIPANKIRSAILHRFFFFGRIFIQTTFTRYLRHDGSTRRIHI